MTNTESVIHLIEDSDSDADVAEILLNEAGFRVFRYPTLSKERLIRNIEKYPETKHIVLLDLFGVSPESPKEIIENVQGCFQSRQDVDIEIVVLSGGSSPELVQMVKSHGLQFLSKNEALDPDTDTLAVNLKQIQQDRGIEKSIWILESKLDQLHLRHQMAVDRFSQEIGSIQTAYQEVHRLVYSLEARQNRDESDRLAGGQNVERHLKGLEVKIQERIDRIQENSEATKVLQYLVPLAAQFRHNQIGEDEFRAMAQAIRSIVLIKKNPKKAIGLALLFLTLMASAQDRIVALLRMVFEIFK
jgi:hypothetical protein